MVYWNGYKDIMAEWKSTGLIKVWNEIDSKRARNDSEGTCEFIDEEKIKVYIGKGRENNYDGQQF